MARTDYFPPRDADFDGWFGNFVVRHALAEREGRVGSVERGSAYGGGVIIHRGANFLIESGYNLSEAEAEFGQDWLAR